MSKCIYDVSEDCNNTDCLTCVLDKIRVEIESYDNFILCANGQKGIHIDKALEIIDKYRAEVRIRNDD